MIADRQWIGAMRSSFRKGQYTAVDKEKLEIKIENYEVACDLSEGKDPKRSAAWHVKAKDAAMTLAKFTGTNP